MSRQAVIICFSRFYGLAEELRPISGLYKMEYKKWQKLLL
jgi:hypothetical protein